MMPQGSLALFPYLLLLRYSFFFVSYCLKRMCVFYLSFLTGRMEVEYDTKRLHRKKTDGQGIYPYGSSQTLAPKSIRHTW